MAETVLAVLPLPMDMGLAARVMAAIAREFPDASVRDGEHSGTYVSRAPGGLPARTMEVFVRREGG